jgi:hypothetical protein
MVVCVVVHQLFLCVLIGVLVSSEIYPTFYNKLHYCY